MEQAKLNPNQCLVWKTGGKEVADNRWTGGETTSLSNSPVGVKNPIAALPDRCCHIYRPPNEGTLRLLLPRLLHSAGG